MGITLADLDRWDPGSVRAVADAAAKRAHDTREVAHDVSGIMRRLIWSGESAESARVKALAITTQLLTHADECDHAAREVASAASRMLTPSQMPPD